MDISEKLGDILSSPEKLSQVMQAVGGLVGSSDPPSPPHPPQDSSADILSALNSLDPKLLSSIAGILGQLGREDERTALMRALKPHLSPPRAQRVDRAVQILRISSAVRAALSSFKGGVRDVQSI